MTLRWFSLLVLSLLVAVPVQAQSSDDGCEVGSLSMEASAGSADNAEAGPDQAAAAAVTDATPAVSVSPSTEAEQFVQDVIAQDGLHVVHFWAPWCANSKRELQNGWAQLVADNPNVTFTFVTVWNDGQKGTASLDEYNLPDRVNVVAQPDLGPSDDESMRRRSFLTHPVTWIPSTWIFHNRGELAFALNYGEMDRGTLQSLLEVTRREW